MSGTIRFTATQVLTLEEGVSCKTENIETEDEHKARLEKEKAATGKTLWEQLEENKQKAKEEYDATTKLIFAPPKALDEEEIAHLEAVAAKETAKKQNRRQEEDIELANFAAMRANQVLSSVEPPPRVPSPRSHAPKEPTEPPKPKFSVKIKRKEKEANAGSNGTGEGRKGEKVEPPEKKSKNDTSPISRSESGDGGKGSEPPPANPLGLIASYGSEDEDED